MHFVSERRDHRLVAVAFASIALALVAMFAIAAQAQAAETLYWDNYGANTLASANIDGSGGGTLNLGGSKLKSPEGMAYDTVTNRLFVASEEGTSGQILAVNLDGSGATPFTAPGAPIEGPEGVAVDPASRTIYWENVTGGTISWANLDGSSGGTLNTTGAPTNNICCRIAIDPVGGRVFWVDYPTLGGAVIAYANLNNTGGGELNLTGTTITPGDEGLAVDPAARRLYFLGGNGKIGYANLDGSGGGDVPTGTAPFNSPWGLALDPSLGRLYWGNEGNGEGESTNAFGFVGTDGSNPGGISVATTPVYEPQDPIIIKSPAGTGAPAVTKDATNPALLACSTGSWAPDYAGSFVYQAPRSYGYQWSLNGAAISGATSSTLTATAPGSYTCTVTATNQSGSASQTSGAFAVAAPPAPPALRQAKFRLVLKTKKARVKAGKVAKFKVMALNQGDLGAKIRICVKVPKKARKVLKPKCAGLGSVAGQGKKAALVKVKAKPQAKGTYKLKFLVKGAPGKPAKAKLQIID